MSFVRHYVMTTTPDQAEALARVLAELRTVVSECEGSLRIDLLAVDSEPHRFFFIEHWASRDDHAAAGSQLPADLMKSLKGLLAAAPEAHDLTEPHIG
ncbi:putative quinol monooxygenase [Novosphingobium aquimarinum]|uniref:putative quinol monooxygenase n=1 Tax=Novosphingobium aquimarinum TaxID=2682494 RepID=UPI0012EB57E1|nr:antibiotic biosynthesis monooxygenase family protein [Novosphingobium aquimarinum]